MRELLRAADHQGSGSITPLLSRYSAPTAIGSKRLATDFIVGSCAARYVNISLCILQMLECGSLRRLMSVLCTYFIGPKLHLGRDVAGLMPCSCLREMQVDTLC